MKERAKYEKNHTQDINIINFTNDLKKFKKLKTNFIN